MLLWEINLNSRFFKAWRIRKMLIRFCGMVSCWIDLFKLDKYKNWTILWPKPSLLPLSGPNHFLCTYHFYVLSLFLIFIDDFNSPEELCIFILIPLVLVWLIDVMMNFILRLKYVEHSKITEPALKTLLLTIFCRSCSYGEMGNYIKIQNESNIEPLSHYPRVP